MAHRRALFLDANHVTAYSAQGGRILSEGYFAGDAPGLQAFAEYLQARRSSNFYLLADVQEEGYQIEDVPFVSGADRKALIERRLGQYFYGTPLSAAMSLGRAKSGRRDEKMLFMALTRPQSFEPWLATLRQCETRLAGVFPVPLVLAALLKAPELRSGRYLLLSLTHAGLRQTFVHDGQMRFSRLTPLATSSVDEFSIACAAETGKIYQYLVGQRQIERGKTLNTLVLAHAAETVNLRQRCRNSDELRFKFIDLADLASKSGLKTPLANSHAETLLLHSLLTKTPTQQLAPAAERRFYRLWQWRFGLNAAAAVILASCLLFAAKGILQGYGMLQDIDSVKADTLASRQKYRDVLETLPPMPVTADQLRAIVAKYDEVEKHSPAIGASFRQISRALEKSPQVELQQLDWSPASSPTASVTHNSGASASPAAPTAQPGAASSGNYVITEIQAQLPVSIANDHRAILTAVDHFVNELKKNDRMTVTVLHMPFDLASGKTIKSSGNEAATEAEAPRFSLRLVQAI